MSTFRRACPLTKESKSRVHFYLLLLLAFAVPRSAFSQVLYGSLTGNVTDPTGLVVVGAKVEVLNSQTGSTSQATTNDRGIHQFTSLQSGVYKVTVEAASFKTFAQDGVRIDANAVRSVDAQLQLGEVKELVEVTADVDLLQTDRADVSTQLQARQIADLPITSIGRAELPSPLQTRAWLQSGHRGK